MHPKLDVLTVLDNNGFGFISIKNIYCADYTKHGEMAKAILLKELKIDMFFDDFVGYLSWDSSLGPAPIRCLIMPDVYRPYWHDSWKVPDNHDFGRRKYSCV